MKNMDMEEMILKGMKSNVSDFFSKLIEFKTNIELSALYQKEGRLSTYEALKACSESINPVIIDLIEGYQGVYIIVRIHEITVGTINPIDYLTKIYEMLKEAKGFFVDSWIHKEIDNLSKIIALTLFKLKYAK